MTKRQMERLVGRYVADGFPSLRARGDMLARHDGDPILRGLFFDRSQMAADSFRVEAFAQPLFVPADHINLSIGISLGDYTLSDPGSEASVFERVVADARLRGVPFLDAVSSVESLARHIGDVPGWRLDTDLARETRAYCLIYSGDRRAAGHELRRLRRPLRFSEPADPDLGGRVREMSDALDRSGGDARALLDRWCEQTKDALELRTAASPN